MGETSDQILNHIESQRHQLGNNLNELESRVRSTTDWRTHFDRNPMLMLGAALGGGVLLGSLVMSGKRRKSWSSSRYSGSTYPDTPTTSETSERSVGTASRSKSASGPATQYQKQRASETIDNIKAALIGFGVARAKEFLAQALPGFHQHMDEQERRSTSQGQPQGSKYEGESGSTSGETHSHGGQQHAHPGGNQPHSHEGGPQATPSQQGGWQGSTQTPGSGWQSGPNQPNPVGTPS